MKRLTQTIILTLISTVLLTGCITSRNVYPDKNFFVLEVSRDRQPFEKISDQMVEVRGFSSPSLKSGNEFVYRYPEGEYKSDYYNVFFVKPARMVTEQTNNWISDSGLFSSVVNPENAYDAGLIIEGNISKLYADFSGTEDLSVMEIKFFINRVKKGKYVTVFNKSYEKEIKVENRSPETLVRGWNTALEQILSDFEDDVAASLKE